MNAERERELAERQRELTERFAAEDMRHEDEDVRAVLSTEAGRRLFSSILGRGHVFGVVFARTNGSDSRLAYETGRREACVDIYRKANMIAPELVLKAIEERNAICHERNGLLKDIENEYKENEHE